MTEYFAHSKENRPVDEWHLLQTHLKSTANLSGDFASVFGMKEIGSLIGLLHDLGKYSCSFQARLHGSKEHIDHSSAGAQVAKQKYGSVGHLMAYAIAGHHSGLPNGGSDADSSSLEGRLKKTTAAYDAFWRENQLPEKSPRVSLGKSARQGFSVSLLTRMLFSCLVDADYLDTENFFHRELSNIRQQWPVLGDLTSVFDNYIAGLLSEADDTEVNRQRAYVRNCCRRAAEEDKGLFSLMVPTGGGKTLSSLEFALHHAQRHKLQRIIYAIPFTSIIEQTASVFSMAVGENAVLEHHSNFHFSEDDSSINYRLRLATENWDAPIVVTTNVQLFESLMSCKSSRCRKLHNIANSVIILDEVQTLPDDLLKPCIAIMEELVRFYGCSLVLCTATQPDFSALWSPETKVADIIPDAMRLYQALGQRVQVGRAGRLADDDLVGRLLTHEQVLCVVNTRKHARKLFKMLPEADENFHLSANMTPQHRSRIIKVIKERLARGQSCRVIATQVIEAGVDIDFPTVFRAMAGLDSIAQAAGRANREGKQIQGGMVWVFEPEDGLPRGWFERMANLGRRAMDNFQDPLSPEALKAFFAERFDLHGDLLDKHGILRDLEEGAPHLNFAFQDITEHFQFIDNESIPLVIAAGNEECQTLLTKAQYSDKPGFFARQLQSYTISLYPWEFDRYARAGLIKSVGDLFSVLYDEQFYSERLGLLSINEPAPVNLIV